jgi:hypothetical protein
LGGFSAEDHALLFPLTGAHRAQDCADCHTNGQYANTPTTCHGCHQEPETHAGQFGTSCANCHTTDEWQAAKLTTHTFPLEHGGMGELPCATCHVEKLSSYSCAICHDNALMVVAHQTVKTENLTNCAGCHLVGNSAETDRLRE